LQEIDETAVLRLRWAEVPAGTTNLWGDLLLDLEYSPEFGRVIGLTARESSGEFGGTIWNWVRPWGLTDPEAESEEREE